VAFVSACVAGGREFRTLETNSSTCKLVNLLADAPKVPFMPVEGQWRRANTPLSPRDKRLLAAVAATAAIAALALAIAYAVRPAATSNAGCVVIDVPSTMGG